MTFSYTTNVRAHAGVTLQSIKTNKLNQKQRLPRTFDYVCSFVHFFSYAFPVRFLYLFVFNSWVRASVPRVIAGTRICKLVTRSLVVDGHRVEASPNSRVRRSIVSEEVQARRSSVWSNSYEKVHRSLLRLRVFFVPNFQTTVRGLTKFKTRRSLSDEYDG